MKSILQKILKKYTEAYLKRHKPKIIAITGSNGKTTTREAVYAVLKNKYKVRKSQKNYNTEIGVPFSVLGLDQPKSILGWPVVLYNAYQEAYFSKDVPEILILEMAADKPGDIRYLTSFISPDISIVTAIGDLPVHVGQYAGPKAVAEEKSNLIKALDENGVAILNYDDKMVLEMKDKTKAHIITYGFSKDSMIKAAETNVFLCESKDDNFCGTTFKVEFDGKVMPIKLRNAYGKPSVYSALAAFAVARIMNVNLVEAVEALSDFKPPLGRMNLIKVSDYTFVLDDTYNASPLATAAALDVLSELPAKRKIVALGDMKELGRYNEEAHIRIGEKAAGIANYILAVGENAQYIEIGATNKKFPEENIYKFKHSLDVRPSLKSLIEEGDLILVKGSQSVRMELVVEDIMAEPERKKELLVRQDWPWKDKSGKPRLL